MYKRQAQQLAVIQELISIVKQADQNSIMLYSQRNGYIFDMTYACHEATEQFQKFKSKAVPFRQMIKKNNVCLLYTSITNTTMVKFAGECRKAVFYISKTITTF